MGATVRNLSGIDKMRPFPIQVAKDLGFDSTTHYQFAHMTNINRDYNAILSDVRLVWKHFSASDIPYFPHVSVGWDNNPRFNSFRRTIIKNNTPGNFEKALRAACDLADENGVNLITINSWNEWTETSYLLPDNVNGTGYLDAIKRVFTKQ